MTSGCSFDKRYSNKVEVAIPNDITIVIGTSVKNENDSGSMKQRKIEIIQALSVGTDLEINTRKNGKQDKDEDIMEVKEYKDDEIIKKVHASLVD